MAPISVLDESTINKIAAGEVIERPASVVKELLENAIDAGATAVTVEIKEGGCGLIRITDNGCGIPKEQVPTAFLRHATSKISTAEDLLSVSSLGFRGEALASIAAVSQVELLTKTDGSLTGTRYQIEGGRERGLEEIGVPEGTTILVRNLFFNTPARKKFLKSPVTEGSHVAALVEKIALSHPDISIRFIQNGQNKLYTSGNNSLKDLIYTVFGREITANLLEVNSQIEGIHITGFIGKPVIARSNRNYENYFVNGRYVRSSIIARAIEEAYKPFMMQHKYPFTMLHLAISPQTLDVNVHPTKMELRFSDGELVNRCTLEAVAGALAQKELIPQVKLWEEKKEKPQTPPKSAMPEPFEVKRKSYLSAAAADKVSEDIPAWKNNNEKKSHNISMPEKDSEKKSHSIQVPEKAAVSPRDQAQSPSVQKQRQEAAPRQLDLFEEKLLDPKARQKHKLIGQLFDTYWLVEYMEQLFIIDQHAAHEKVLYERTMEALRTRQYDTQLVNPPIILTLNMNEELLLKRYMDYFKDMGFEIEPFGGREYAVRGVPSNLPSIARKELLLEMLDGLSEDMVIHKPDLIYEKVASMSCKAAVKGKHTMSAAEADKLIDALLDLENPYACPHGRPTIISMTRYELEKKFKRIV